jgi:predicted nuclease of predicted toxin-antitoxin system
MKLLVDMNLSPTWIAALGDGGFEAAHWSAVGAHDATDSEIMAFASANGFVVLTHDLDFGAILAANRERTPSVVQVRADDVSPEAIGKRVVDALRQMSGELERGALVTVDLIRTRLRVLPFPPAG